MHVINIDKNKILKNKYTYIITILVILIVVISYGFFYIQKRDNVVAMPDVLKATSYVATYNCTVISNKTVNTYYVKEYQKNNNFRYEFLDKMKNLFITVINKEGLYIENRSQIAKFKTFEYVSSNTNLMSYKTLVDIYNAIVKAQINCSCMVNSNIKNDEIVIVIEAKNCINNTCKMCNIYEQFNCSKIKLALNRQLQPVSYTIYDTNGNEKICVVYESFEMVDVSDELFIIGERDE